MKRGLCIILALVIMLGLLGSTALADPTTPPTTPPPPPTPPTPTVYTVQTTDTLSDLQAKANDPMCSGFLFPAETFSYDGGLTIMHDFTIETAAGANVTFKPTGEANGIDISKKKSLSFKGKGNFTIDGTNANGDGILINHPGKLNIEDGLINIKNTKKTGINENKAQAKTDDSEYDKMSTYGGSTYKGAFTMTGGTLNITDCATVKETAGFYWGTGNVDFLAGTINILRCGFMDIGSMYVVAPMTVGGGATPAVLNLENSPTAFTTLVAADILTVKNNGTVNISIVGNSEDPRCGIYNNKKVLLDGGTINITSKYVGTGDTYGIAEGDIIVNSGLLNISDGKLKTAVSPHMNNKDKSRKKDPILTVNNGEVILNGSAMDSTMINVINGGSVKMDDGMSYVKGVSVPNTDKVYYTPINSDNNSLVRFDVTDSNGKTLYIWDIPATVTFLDNSTPRKEKETPSPTEPATPPSNTLTTMVGKSLAMAGVTALPTTAPPPGLVFGWWEVNDKELTLNVPIYENIEAMPVFSIGGKITLSGTALKKDQFEFELVQVLDNKEAKEANNSSDLIVSKARNDDNGNFVFKPRTPDREESVVERKVPPPLKFKVTQKNDKQSNITYDSSVYYVELTLNHDGPTSATIQKNGKAVNEIVFNNTYTSPYIPPAPSQDTGITGEHKAYIKGYPDGTIKPDDAMTRAEVSELLFRLISEADRAKYKDAKNTFTDVKADSWCYQSVTTITAMGLMNCRNASTFDPNASITRAEFAAVACRMFKTAEYVGADLFTDISDCWAKGYINAAAKNSWVTNVGNSKFFPNNKLTRAQAVTILNRALNRLPETTADLVSTGMPSFKDNTSVDAWYYLAMQEAAVSHKFKMKADKVHETWTAILP